MERTFAKCKLGATYCVRPQGETVSRAFQQTPRADVSVYKRACVCAAANVNAVRSLRKKSKIRRRQTEGNSVCGPGAVKLEDE